MRHRFDDTRRLDANFSQRLDGARFLDRVDGHTVIAESESLPQPISP